VADAAAIHELIASYTSEGILLPRTEENVREHVSTFLVLEERAKIIGCVSLENYGTDLAEIRSLAVSPEIRGLGLGGRLVEFALEEARRKKIARVFAVTHAPGFFMHHGFAASSRSAVPEKIERDCRTCPKVRHCHLMTVIATVIAERVALPVLDGVATPSLV
jgi:N-acetylglutamate synthase-like GNAT family acetyltransferase